MPSTYTLNNGIELIGTGEQSGTWGDTTNTNLELLDSALDGQVTVTLASAGSSGSPNALPISDGAASNGRNRMVIFDDGGDLGATAYVQLTPNDAEKIIYVRNDLSGSRSIILFQGTYNASNDYEVPAGTTAVVFFDGAGSGAVAANVFNNAYFDAVTTPSLTATTADINGGTIDGTVIGGSTPAAGSFTTLSASTSITGTLATAAQTNITSVGSLTSLDVTGTVTADGLTVDGTTDATEELARFGNNAGTQRFLIEQQGSSGYALKSSVDLRLHADYDDNSGDTGSSIEMYTDGTQRMSVAGSTGDITFYDTSGNASFVYDESAGSTFNEQGDNKDFRVESNANDHMLFVDAGTNRVGINNSAPRAYLDISTDTSANAEGLTLRTTTTTSNVNVPSISFSHSGDRIVSQMQSVNDGAFGSAALKFSTYPRGSWTQSASELKNRFFIGSGSNTPSIVCNDDGENYDFRVESDVNAHALFVDAGNDRVGIGSSSPDSKLDLFLGLTTSGDYITTGNTNRFGNGLSKLITFKHGYNTPREVAAIAVNTVSNSPNIDGRGDLYFYTGTSGASDGGSTSTQRLRIDYAGNVTFNDTGTNSDFRVESSNATHILFVDADTDRVGIRSTAPASIFHIDSVVPGTAIISLGDDTGTNGGPHGFDFYHDTADSAKSSVYFRTANNTLEFESNAGERHTVFYLETGEATFNETGRNDADFRVESDSDSHMIFVDASANAVIFGGSSAGQDNSMTIYSSGSVDMDSAGADNTSTRFRWTSPSFTSGSQTKHGIQLFNGSSHNIQIGFLTDSGGSVGSLFDTSNVNLGTIIRSDTNGVRLANNGTSWSSYSDSRLKTVTGEIPNAIDKIDAMRGVLFSWNEDEDNTQRCGVIAQEVQAVLPEVVDDDSDFMQVRYTEIIPLLIQGIKEQKATIETLEARITALENA